MSIPAQGAVGAETMTADWADTRPNLGAPTNEPSLREVLFAYYKPWFQPGKAMELSNRYIAALASPRADSDERTAGEVLKEACKPWEYYTGEPPDDGSPLSGVFVAGMVYTERLLAKLLGVAHYEGGDGSEDFDADATQTLRNILTGARLWDADENRPVSATPAQPARPLPDSLRALSEAATKGEWYTESEKCDGSYGSGEDCGEGYLAYSILTDAEPRYGNPGVIAETSNSTLGVIHEEADEDGFTAWDETARANTAFIVAAVNFVRTLLASHPAGQSAGSGAEAGGSVEVIERCVKLAKDAGLDSVTITGSVRHWQGIIAKLREPAPDSTRTGDEGTDRPDGAIHNGREHLRRLGLYGFTANDGHVLDCCEDYIGAQQCFEVMAEALAARPAAPEAQGAWLPISTVPKDGSYVLLHSFLWLDEPVRSGAWNNGIWAGGSIPRDFPPTQWQPMPAPPASSGQGGY